MKGYKAIVVASVFLMLMSVMGSALTQAEDVDTEENDYIVREPIRIDGNDDFTAQAAAEGWPGDGSEEDPYVIEGYEIDGTGYGYGIYVGNTTVHFVVRGCYVHNASGVDPYGIYNPNSGLSFYNVKNSRLDNNKLSTRIGIYLYESRGNIIANNTILDNYHGIYLYFSNDNKVTNNTIPNGIIGVFLRRSNRNIISNNNIHNETVYRGAYGIWLIRSNDNIIVNNNISGFRMGILLDTSYRFKLDNNTFFNNDENIVEVYAVSENGFISIGNLLIAGSISIATIAIVIFLMIRRKKLERKSDKDE